MYINEECINCSACMDECDQDAIYDPGAEHELNGVTHPALSEDFTYIVPELCDDCKSCVDACAVDAIEER